MLKKSILGACLSLAGGFAYFATELKRSAPIITIAETSFPSCETRTYTISQAALKVAGQNHGLMHVVSSPALLLAASDPTLRTLESFYDNPRVMDGFELTFRLNLPGEVKTVTVRNRYIPALYRILEESNKLLPPNARFTEKEHFVWMNTQLRQDIIDYRNKPDMPEEWRARVIAELESQVVKLDE